MQTVTIPQALEIALQHHRSGRLAEAETIYQQILAHDPNHADALHLLGVIAHQAGRNALAADLIRKAIGRNPAVAQYHYNMGKALAEQRELEGAIAACRRAIELKPDFVEAQNNLGNALKEQGRLDQAIVAYRRALELKPDYAEARNNLGNALRADGQPDEAIAEYQRAIRIRPDFAEAHFNLGGTLSDQGRIEDAIAACRRSIEIMPDHAEAHNNLGNVLGDRSEIDEAISSYRRALRLKPGYAEAHNNLGNALREKGRLDEAISTYRTALEHKPDYAEAHNNLGNALKDQGRVNEAIVACRRGIELKPDSADFHSNLLLFLHYLPEIDPHEMLREHRRWDDIHAQPLMESVAARSNDRDPDRRLRIGCVSADFRAHSVALFVESLLEHHDAEKMEVFCYANVVRADQFTARFQRYPRCWRNIARMSDSQVADLVRGDQIDILVDLAGHTARNRLLVFGRKPAPIQVTWLGYPDTTGMGAMAYRLTDAHADPPGTTEQFHSEQLIRLPETFACFRPPEDSPPAGPLPALARGHITLASFHTLAKLNDRLLEWWARILLQVPNSRLLMVAAGLNEASCRQRLIDFFAGHGVGCERLEFRARQTLHQYLAVHGEVDLLLDSHPFTGHTISCHALWMGVPVVTLAGDLHYSRMVTSVLSNLGLPELIARTPSEYVRIASELAGDRSRLANLRATLRDRMQASPLMNAPRFTRNVEHAYREMWRTWCATQSPMP